MIELVRPTVDLADSWWRMVDAFGAEPMYGSGYRRSDRDLLANTAAFEVWVDWIAQCEQPGPQLGPGMVPGSYRWIVDVDRVVGTICVRHALTDALVERGGHIGYAVEPGSRRRGVASAALRQAVELARVRDIDPVLLTCDEDNVVSRRVIESSGGVLEDVRGGSRRYWITTGVRADPIDGRPIQTRQAILVPIDRDDIRAMLAGDLRADWAPGYPREDDLDGVRLVADADAWSARHIVRREDGLVVGSIGCFGPPTDGAVEIGYGLVESARGGGLMTDVLGGLCRAIEASGIRVTAHTEPDNLASARVLARLGFRHVGDDEGQWRWERAGAAGGAGGAVGAVGSVWAGGAGGVGAS